MWIINIFETFFRIMFHLIRQLFHKIKIALLHLQFIREFRLFKEKNESDRFPIEWLDRDPCLDDKIPSQDFDRHHLLHTAWAARILANLKPTEHVDISSFLYFSTLVSAFIPIRYYDLHPPRFALNGLKIEKADLIDLPFANSSIRSLSCMHVLEHIGLGRYNDPIDPQADLKAIVELKRVLTPGGYLLLVVPIGSPKVMFNARRVYGYQQIVSYFYPFQLVQFSLIPDDPRMGDFLEGASKEFMNTQKNACGCFLFKKLP
ncbi:MAG: DUF268 domain-containing protein [Desulfobacteraceae bacterium]|nr:MAG: DUF268 domain-containing protein [Desulfobacteraceae bacterium]